MRAFLKAVSISRFNYIDMWQCFMLATLFETWRGGYIEGGLALKLGLAVIGLYGASSIWMRWRFGDTRHATSAAA